MAHEKAVKDYTAHIKATAIQPLNGIKIAVDCANGSASATARDIFDSLGIDCIYLNDNPDGLNINRDCGSTHLEKLSQFVVENGLDAGFAFDGDADRCLCIDENGNQIDGDMIMAICAYNMKNSDCLAKNTVVGTVMTNLGFVKFCEQNGLHFEVTKVGDRFVMEKMIQEGYCFGGEQSGHIIFREYSTTGDGQLTAVQLLSVMKKYSEKLSALSSIMTRYPQVMINVKLTAEGRKNFDSDCEIKSVIDNVAQDLGNDGRILVRLSGTEPLVRVMCEGINKEKIQYNARRVANIIESRLGDTK